MSKLALVALLIVIAVAAIFGGFLLGRKEAVAPTATPTVTPLASLTPVPTPTPANPLNDVKTNPYEDIDFNPFD